MKLDLNLAMRLTQTEDSEGIISTLKVKILLESFYGSTRISKERSRKKPTTQLFN